MAELESPVKFSFRLLVFVAAFLAAAMVLIVVLYEINNVIGIAAKQKCPADTFLSGMTYAREGSWAAPAVMVALLFAGMNAVMRPPFFPKGYPNKMDMPWRPRTVRALWAFIILAAAAMYVTSATTFCLGSSGIYTQALPGGSYREAKWKDIKSIFVDCAARRRSPDLSYILTFTDGRKLDIADTWPINAEEAFQFQAKLAGLPFLFTANVAPSCPYGGWVGQRP